MTLHAATGRARVRLDGRDIYLGAWGAPEAKREYDRVMAEWLAGGRAATTRRAGRGAGDGVTITELIVAFVKAKRAPEGEPDRSFDGSIKPALRRLRKLYGDTLANDFTPARFDALILAAVGERDENGRRLSRQYINAKLISRVKRLFKWGVRKGLVDASVYHALTTVEGMEAGSTDAPERKRVLPVEDATVEATIPLLPPVVRDMVTVQRLTGARPGEVCAMSWSNIDRSGEVWWCRLEKHKTAHHGKARSIAIGPNAQSILVKYLARPIDVAIFSPAENAVKQRGEWRAARRSKVTPSQEERAASVRSAPQRKYADAYTTVAYAAAIRRACERRAKLDAKRGGLDADAAAKLLTDYLWHPNRLRHTMATATRRQFGLEGAQVVLGHSKADITQVYAERDSELAARVARQVG
jgi:integrase